MNAVGKITSASWSSTESTAASSLSVTWISDAPRTASIGWSKALAPSASSAWAFSGVRCQTCTVSPRSSSLRTKLAPSSPVPSHAINVILLCGSALYALICHHEAVAAGCAVFAAAHAFLYPRQDVLRERLVRIVVGHDEPFGGRRIVAQHHCFRPACGHRGVPLVVRRDGRAERHAGERGARVAERVVRRAQVVQRVQRAERDEDDRRQHERDRRPA